MSSEDGGGGAGQTKKVKNKKTLAEANKLSQHISNVYACSDLSSFMLVVRNDQGLVICASSPDWQPFMNNSWAGHGSCSLMSLLNGKHPSVDNFDPLPFHVCVSELNRDQLVHLIRLLGWPAFSASALRLINNSDRVKASKKDHEGFPDHMKKLTNQFITIPAAGKGTREFPEGFFNRNNWHDQGTAHSGLLLSF